MAATGGSGDTSDEKRALRRELLALRRGLAVDVVAEGSDAIVAHLRVLPELAVPAPAGPLSVLLYAADPDEVMLDRLIGDPPDGWRILLPRVEAGDIVVVPHPPGTPLARGTLGIREPVGAAIDPAEVDVVVVPGVAFTPEGARLGRGAGMYDRLLPRTGGALRIGVCLETFVRDRLPVEPHDAGVDMLVTDASVRRRTDPEGAPPA